MKIVKPGKLPDSIAFTCSVCGCEYEADSKDYMLSDIMLIGNKIVNRIYTCNCPCCGWSNTNTNSIFKLKEDRNVHD